MSEKINLMPDALANQIAAGEVVQRPASVVKELLENSVDAGATEVRLVVKDAGKTLIQVTDNGSGMGPLDARMCFERHATSKIASSDDLFRLSTFGFRGEALASIAAVAEVELKTKRVEDQVGQRILVSNSKATEQEPIVCQDGTQFSIRNLFFNIPARKVFLKTDNVEFRHIEDEFMRIAMSHPEVAFSLEHNGHVLYQLRSENLKQRIVALLGQGQLENLIPVDEPTRIVSLTGFIGKPSLARRSRGQQFFFANGRYIRDAYLHHAVMNAYKDLIPDGHYPLYVLFMEIDPAAIDVNVHPTKTEVKFEDEKAVYAILYSALRKSLAQFQLAPSLDFESETVFQNPGASITGNTRHSGFGSAPMNQLPGGSGHIPAVTIRSSGQSNSPAAAWKSLYEVAIQTANPTEHEQVELPLQTAQPEEEKQKQLFQLHQAYVVAQIKSGMLVIDQNAAHERILFEQFLSKWQNQQQVPVQQILFPVRIEMSVQEAQILRENLEDLLQLGYELTEFGPTTFLVQGLPVDVEGMDATSLIQTLVDQVRHQVQLHRADRREALARTLARLQAIPSGKLLNQVEMERLINQLFACQYPDYTPDGRQTLFTLSLHEIAERLKPQA